MVSPLAGLRNVFFCYPLAHARGCTPPAASRLGPLAMASDDLMHAIDTQLAHVWMVRAFLKHSEEAEEDEELAGVHRELYDFMLALGGPLKEGNAEEYLKLANKKFSKLKRATETFEIGRASCRERV